MRGNVKERKENREKVIYQLTDLQNNLQKEKTASKSSTTASGAYNVGPG